MLFKIKKVKTEEETVEVQLPAFFKEGQWFYMITEDQTVIRLSELAKGLVITIWEKENLFHDDHIQEAYKGVPVSPYEFFKVWHQAMDLMEATIQTPLFTTK